MLSRDKGEPPGPAGQLVSIPPSQGLWEGASLTLPSPPTLLWVLPSCAASTSEGERGGPVTRGQQEPGARELAWGGGMPASLETQEGLVLPRNSKQGKRHKVLLLDIRKPGKPHWEGCIWADWSKPRRYQSVAMREQTGPSPWGRTVCGCWRPDKEAGAAGAC